MITIGDRLNQYTTEYQLQEDKIAQISKYISNPNDAEKLSNQYKIQLIKGSYDNSAKFGRQYATLWNNPYSLDQWNFYNEVKKAYGHYEKTWIEVNRVKSVDEQIIDEKGEHMTVTLNW